MPKDTVLPCADALCRWCDKHYPPVCKAAEQALMSPSEGSTPCSTWRNQSSTAKGYPHQGHGPTETSTEPQLKCIMWDTHTRKDTGKEKKKKRREYAYTDWRIMWTWKHLLTKPQKRMSLALSQNFALKQSP